MTAAGKTFLLATPDGWADASRAESALRAAGFSVAPGGFTSEIRGIKHGAFDLQPYWHLAREERALLDGIVIGGGARGPVTVCFYADAPAAAIRAFAEKAGLA